MKKRCDGFSVQVEKDTIVLMQDRPDGPSVIVVHPDKVELLCRWLKGAEIEIRLRECVMN